MAGEQEDYAIVRTLNFGTENAYFLNTGTTNTGAFNLTNYKPAMVYVRAIRQCLLNAGEHFWEIVDFKDHTASSSTVPYKPIEILLKNKRDPMRWMRIFANANPADNNVGPNYYNNLNFQFSDVGPPIGGASNPPLYFEWSQKDNWPDGASSTIELVINWSPGITDKIIWIAEFVDAFAFFVVNKNGIFNYSFMCGKVFETLNSSDSQHWNGHAYDRSVLSEVDATFTFDGLLTAWIPVDTNKRNIILGGITKVEVETVPGTWVEKLYGTEYTADYANGSISFTPAVTTSVRASYYYLPLVAGAGQGHATSRGGFNGEGYLNKRTGYINDLPPQHLWIHSGASIRIDDNTWFPIGNAETIASTSNTDINQRKYLDLKAPGEYNKFMASNVYIKNSNNVYRGAPYPVILKGNDTTVTPAVAMTGLAAFTRYLRAADKLLPNGSTYDSVDPSSQQSWRFYSTDTTKKFNDTILWNKNPIAVPASPYPSVP